MLFALVHKNSPLTTLLYLVILIALWLSYILNPNDVFLYYDSYPMPLYALLLKLKASSIYLCYSMTLIFMGINALLLSRMQVLHRIIDKSTAVPILIYFLLSASFPVFQQCSPLHPALTFVLLGVLSIFKMYKNESGLRPVFEAGFMFAIGSLFYVHLIFFSVFIFVALLVLLPFNWRQWMAGVFGLITPFFIVSSIFFLFDIFDQFYDVLVHSTVVWHKSFAFATEHFVLFLFLALVGLRALMFAFSGSIKKVATKKYYVLFIMFILITAFIFLLVPAAGKEVFFFIIFPLAFIIGNYLENIRSQFWKEVIFSFLLIGVIVIQVLR